MIPPMTWAGYPGTVQPTDWVTRSDPQEIQAFLTLHRLPPPPAFLNGRLLLGVFDQTEITPLQEYILRIMESVYQRTGYSVAWDVGTAQFYLTMRYPTDPIAGGPGMFALPSYLRHITEPPDFQFLRTEAEAVEALFPGYLPREEPRPAGAIDGGGQVQLQQKHET